MNFITENLCPMPLNASTLSYLPLLLPFSHPTTLSIALANTVTGLYIPFALQFPLLFQSFQFFEVRDIAPWPERNVNDNSNEEREGIESIEVGFGCGEATKVAF